MCATGATHTIERVGIFSPKATIIDELSPGGWIYQCGVKTVSDAKVEDTITDDRRPCERFCPTSSHLFLLSFVACFQ